MDKLIKTFGKAAEALAIIVAIIVLTIAVIGGDTVKAQFNSFISNAFTEISNEAGL